jgi:scyllo-inositol 2-dehydrogenase (NADP+)
MDGDAKQVRYAVVGYGSAARTIHLPLLAFEPRMKLHAIVARKPETRDEASNKHVGVKVYASVEEMLADGDVDLVIVTTPHESHAPIAIQSLDAGKNVVVDKPMCLNLAEYDAMRAAQERSGKVLTVFHNARLSGDFLTLLSIVDSGRLGELKWLEVNWNRHGLSKRSAWRNDASHAGGRLIDLGVHLFDQVLQVFPERVTSVYTRINRDWPDAQVESACIITIAFETGRTAIVDVGSMTRIPKPKYHAIGTNGTWTKPGGLVDPQDAALASGNYADAAEDVATIGTLVDPTGTYPTPTIAGDWRKFYANVAEVLIDHAVPLVNLDEMRRVIGVMEAAIESDRRGEVVRL